MSFIKNILGKPFLLLLTIILLWFFTLLLKVNSNKFYGILAAFTALSFVASFIFIVIQKKWFKLIYASVLYLVVVIGGILLYIFSMMSMDPNWTEEAGNKEFYKNEIKKTTGLDIPSDFSLIAKIDTIQYMGMEYEYDAECMYSGPTKSICYLESKIKSNPKFRIFKNEDIFDTGLSTKIKNRTIDFNSFTRWYIYEEDGRFIIKIGFNKKSMYYNAHYY